MPYPAWLRVHRGTNLGQILGMGPIQRGWWGKISFLEISSSDPLSRRYKIKERISYSIPSPGLRRDLSRSLTSAGCVANEFLRNGNSNFFPIRPIWRIVELAQTPPFINPPHRQFRETASRLFSANERIVAGEFPQENSEIAHILLINPSISSGMSITDHI